MRSTGRGESRRQAEIISAKVLRAVLDSPSMNDDDPLWTTEQTAAFLAVNPETLARWRRRDYGPPAIPLVDGRGGMVRYDPASVRAWVSERTKKASA